MSKRMEGVREYGNSDVLTCRIDGRLCIEAHVPPTGSATHVDLADVIEWVRREHPEMLGTVPVDIVFDGPPGPVSGRFVEVESPPGKSIRIGEWVNRPDGFHALRIQREAPIAAAGYTMAHMWNEKAKTATRAPSTAPTASPSLLSEIIKPRGSEMLDHCGADAARWASYFCSIAKDLGVRKVSGAHPDLDVQDIDEEWMIGWFANAIEHGHQVKTRTDPSLSASEAVYGVLAALTCRDRPMTFSRRHDASIAAEFAQAFCDENDLADPREHWAQYLTHPPGDFRPARDYLSEGKAVLVPEAPTPVAPEKTPTDAVRPFRFRLRGDSEILSADRAIPSSRIAKLARQFSSVEAGQIVDAFCWSSMLHGEFGRWMDLMEENHPRTRGVRYAFDAGGVGITSSSGICCSVRPNHWIICDGAEFFAVTSEAMPHLFKAV